MGESQAERDRVQERIAAALEKIAESLDKIRRRQFTDIDAE